MDVGSVAVAGKVVHVEVELAFVQGPGDRNVSSVHQAPGVGISKAGVGLVGGHGQKQKTVCPSPRDGKAGSGVGAVGTRIRRQRVAAVWGRG